MNSRQRRNLKRGEDKVKKRRNIPAKEYLKYKDDQRCIDARRKTREGIPNFECCGSGTGGYVSLVCNGCPAFEIEKDV